MLRTLILLLLAAPLLGRAQPQLAFDTTSTQDPIVYTGTVASNGDRVLAVRGSTGTVLWRAMADGTPVWARQIGTGAPQLTADEAGGAVLLQYAYTEQFDADQSGFDDTLRIHYVLTKVAQDGDVSWAKKVSIDLRYIISWPSVNTLRLIRGQNSIFVVLRAPNALNALSILKIDDQGQLLWSRSYSSNALPDSWEVECVTGNVNGGLYLSFANSPSSWTYMAQVLADGSLGWVKQVSYTNAPVYFNTSYDLVSFPDGSVEMLGRMNIPDHDYWSTVHLSPQGVVTDAHFYAHPTVGWATLSAMKRMDDGRLLIAMDSVVMALAGNGDVEAAVTMTSHVDGDQRNRFIPFAMSATPEGAVLTGVLDYVHVDLGYTHHRPAIRTIDPNAPGCYVMPVEVNHVPVPTELYEVEDFAGLQEVAVYNTLADTVMTSQTLDPITTTDLCTVMIALGVETIGPRVHQDLQSNVVQQGMPIAFITDEARRVSVIDAAGRSLVRDRLLPVGAASLPTLGWHTGIYLLRVTDAKGTAVRTHRVLVIP
jgi:hypothetical protein